MKLMNTFLTFALCALLLSCGENKNNGKDQGGDGVWVHKEPRVARVEVSSSETLLETYEFSYDNTGRITTLVKTDNMSKAVLLDLQYTYPSENKMHIQGKFYPIATNRFIDVDYDWNYRTFTYSGSWSTGWTYTTRCNEDDIVSETTAEVNFAASGGQYTSKTHYEEGYAVKDGTIYRIKIGSEVDAQSAHTTRTSNSQYLVYDLEYTNLADNQNFMLYIVPCNFPVWAASNLPGCKRLPKSVRIGSGDKGDVTYPESYTFEYEINASGDLETAVRTDYNGVDVVLVRTYKFIYQQ